MIKRALQPLIESKLFKGKIIILYGARQVGKTTLIKNIQNKFPDISLYLNCDEPDIRELLTDSTSTKLRSIIGNKELVLIDEARRVKNIGLTLKLFADEIKNVQVIATGSSSFELSNIINESLTGRKYVFTLMPVSIKEQKYPRCEKSIFMIPEFVMLLSQILTYPKEEMIKGHFGKIF